MAYEQIHGDEPLNTFHPVMLEEWPDDEPLTPVPAVREAQPDERVLVVEDDDAVRRLYVTLLERRGYTVEEAVDGEDGLQRALAGRFDLVLTDLNMPKLDGWGLLARLRDDFRTREVPVAFISCESNFRETLREQRVGAQAYISKGTRLELIAQQIHLLLEPVRRIRRALLAIPPEAIATGMVGPMFLVSSIAEAGWSGTIFAQSDLARFALWFKGGQPIRAEASSGVHVAGSEAAFNAFVGAGPVEGQLSPEKVSVEPNLFTDVETLLQSAMQVLNRNVDRAREHTLVHAKELQVNAALYTLFAQMADAGAVETARLVCEEKLLPAQVLAASSRSPVEIEATLTEMVRRSLIRFDS